MTGHRSRRGGLLAGLLALVVTVVGVTVLGVTVLGTLTPALAQNTSDPRITVELVSQSPFAADGDGFTAQFRVVGAGPGDQLKATLWETGTRDQLREGLETGELFDAGLVRFGPRRAPIESGSATLTVPETFAAGKPGVYPVEITVVRADGDETDPLLLTTLVRTAPLDPAVGALNVALVVPLRAETAHRPDGSIVVEPEERERLLALASLATRFPDIPFAFEPNPETMDALAHGSPDDIAAFNDLASLIREQTILGATYVPVDDEALRLAGLHLMVADLQNAGVQSLSETIGPVSVRIARADPTDTPDTLSLRKDLGTELLLVDHRHLEPLDRDQFPETMLQSFLIEDSRGLPITAMATDGHLADLAAALDDEDSPSALLRQQFLADLLAGYYDDKTPNRGSVVVLPDDWDPVSADAATLLSSLISPSLPEIHVTDLDTVLASTSAASPLGTGGTTGQTDPLVRTLRPEAAPDLRSYGQREAQTDRRLQGFFSVMGTTTSPRSIELDKLRLASADERLDDGARRAYLATVDEQVDGALRSPDGGPGITGPGRQQVTMTSREATLPIQLENNLGVDAHVRIELRSEKLDFPEGWLREVTLTPGTNTIEFAVQSKTSGDSLLEVSVLAPDVDAGLGTLATGTYTVRSTALSGLGLVLGIVAVVVLMTWWARHIIRTRRARQNPVESDVDAVADNDDQITDDQITTTPTSGDGVPAGATPDGVHVDETPRSLSRTET